MNILQIDSSILGDYSVSRQVSAAVTNHIRDSITDAMHTYRDIAANPIPHLSGAYLAAMQNPDAEQSPAVKSDIAQSAEVLAEFLAADIVVIGAGLYNFGIPSQLKAWIDRILVAGKTFRYTAEGKPEGLVGKKRIILAIARGGVYSGESPIASFEHTETYLRTAFGFIGLEAEVVVAEGVSIGPDQRAAAIKNAETQIAAIAF